MMVWGLQAARSAPLAGRAFRSAASPAGSNGNGSVPQFEALPAGALAPSAAPSGGPEVAQPARLDPAYASKLLGPVPGAPPPGRRELHTNRGDDEPAKPRKSEAKVGRNEICPCGSGKKFKRCHGVTA